MQAKLTDGMLEEITEVASEPPQRIIRQQRICGQVMDADTLPSNPIEFIYLFYRVEEGVAVYRYYGAQRK